ncbi:CPBP family intramembrane glutamic endopeptidase [Roseicyclus persicicus]|uniref:CPBP family intramembrane metalloprotease n=1 Tax=Roseicyclus persicicus TaxID=2650661 RepID=A0A7X6GYX4_9RHOB|nr:CPBP family intramembrane glutamic endopeptidase [Roseibacterium persicicum]NKX44941.1 CPBP family intramembrane metalloprotease [Roseibacterium persicicum]
MQYPAHDELVGPARARPSLWRLALGLVLCSAVYAAGIAAIFGLLVAVSGLDGADAWMRRMAMAETPTATLLVLATFLGMGLGPLLAARLLHARPMGSLFGARGRLLRGFAIGAGVCALAYGVTALLPSAVIPTANLAPALWAAFLPLALVGILVQTGAEEVLFRGYLQSQLAARFASPLAWMVLPSALFAVLHYQPAIMGENAWLVVGAVFVFALLAADLTARTGSIGAAWGFHFANNCVAILFVALDGPLSGLALYTIPMGALTPADLRPLLVFDMAVSVAIWAGILALLRLRRA